MITKVSIRPEGHIPCDYFRDVEAFKDNPTFEFEPGLNVVWGPNGSGKSTLLRIIARAKHCEQGGLPLITRHSMSEFWGKARYEKEDFFSKELGFSIEGDDGLVFYLDPEVNPGLVGGMAGFDYDFLSEGVSAIGRKGSSGQLIFDKFARRVIDMKNVDEVKAKEEWLLTRNQKGDENALSMVSLGKGEGRKTILLDEPDKSLDWPRRREVWDFIVMLSTKYQIIVASHSLFALGTANVLGANYVDVGDPTYREKCMGVIQAEMGAFKYQRKGGEGR